MKLKNEIAKKTRQEEGTGQKVETAISSGDQAAAQIALKEAQPEIMRGVTKGLLHKNTASRKVSRLAARVKAVSA